MRTAIIVIAEAGAPVASRIEQSLGAHRIGRGSVSANWKDFDAFIFIGAMGICVRTIAPLVEDKHTDPAVVCVDSLGRHAVAVLSGHVGGANDLTRRVAAILGAEPVITTQSDLSGLWALDTLAERFGWTVVGHAPQRDVSGGVVGHASERDIMQRAIFAFVNRRPTALLIEAHDDGTEYLLNSLPEHVTVVSSLDEVDQRYKLLIVVSPRLQRLEAFLDEPSGKAERPITLQFVPRVLTIGFGLAHQAGPAEVIYDEMVQALAAHGLYPCARQWCTIDVKADEPFVALLREKGETVRFFTAEELSRIDVPTPSAIVAQHVGTPSVCEAAAILGSRTTSMPISSLTPDPSPIGEGSIMTVPKVKGKNWTLAVCIPTEKVYTPLSNRRGGGGEAIEIVGAGPGDPDLISVRGRKMLERADLILYAGSLVPKALTDCHKPGAVVRSSADMTLEEQCALMKEHYDQGHFIVRLHTGDPCIFGAIQEQMAFFDREGMAYHITPGISSFLAAAAELKSQFTIPERTQTIILTRGEGRTPMPEREKLHLLARSQSTMCIFLSAAIVDDVQRELLQEYPEDTPVAACYHLTWPDQKIYRGVLRDLARIVHDNHLTLTTMLVVGAAIDNRAGLSALYDKHFTHLYRKASPGSADVPSALGTQSSSPAIGARSSRPPLGTQSSSPAIADETSALRGAGEDGRAPQIPAWHSRGYLPHVEDRQLQTITFRLYDSVPTDVIKRWVEEADREDSSTEEARIRQAIANYEDQGHGECFLKDSRVAEVVQNALFFYDGVRYRLIRWCIMPNHVHVLIEMNGTWSLSSIMKGWKSFTAHEANKLLGRRGDFWMPEYFDRYIRNQQHYENVVQYIDYNPVKAGLVSSPEDWPWSTLGAQPLRTRTSALPGAGETTALQGETTALPTHLNE